MYGTKTMFYTPSLDLPPALQRRALTSSLGPAVPGVAMLDPVMQAIYLIANPDGRNVEVGTGSPRFHPLQSPLTTGPKDHVHPPRPDNTRLHPGFSCADLHILTWHA